MVDINQLPKGYRRQIFQAVGMVRFRPEARPETARPEW